MNLCMGVLVVPWLDTRQERGRDEAGSTGLGRFLLLGPPASSSGLGAVLRLRQTGHASWAALILCLLVKGQNMRLPNKI